MFVYNRVSAVPGSFYHFYKNMTIRLSVLQKLYIIIPHITQGKDNTLNCDNIKFRPVSLYNIELCSGHISLWNSDPST